MAVDVRISNRSTVVITPRAGPNAPAQTETVTPTVTGTPPTSTPTSTPGATTPTPVGGCSKEEQIEGIVVTNSGGILTIFDQRLGTVTVTASATTIIRKGQTPVLFADIVVGWRVHVKACLVSPGAYLASEIIVQNTNVEVTTTPAAATNTPTITPTKTNTPTVTNTSVATNTPTVTNTSVATNTPTVTNTSVATNTPTVTNTSVATNTPTVTNTATVTPTATKTPQGQGPVRRRPARAGRTP